MSEKLEISPVAPSGRSVKNMLVSYRDGTGAFEARETDDYAKSPDGLALRDERVRLGLSLGAAARAFGLRVSEVSDLEHGRVTCDWQVARDMRTAVWEKHYAG